ncbi:MAG TPA: SDR family oxidoreductase [Gammaproteobacteria bacterium]|jgi:NAD(P)-dependent dehydrogenase (short-subunit alcohol dehydrogenase family)|nr:SDR family oxidoreductase [Gammaproteobacteria bacterium]
MSTLRGKHVLVTGPTAGIGRQIALELAALGANLVLGCRSRERGERVAAELRAVPGAGSVEVLDVDTSSQRSIRDAARELRARHPRLDVLVNNAGVAPGERSVSVDGIELTFATNVLGYYLLTNELLDSLHAAAPARIVNVASMFAGELDLADLQFERRRYDVLQAYAQSKACDRLLTWALARRLAGSGVTANAYAPGFVASTELSRDFPERLKAVYATRTGRTVQQGADTAVWLASSAALEGVSGRFFMDRREVPCEFRDAALEEALWAACARYVA